MAQFLSTVCVDAAEDMVSHFVMNLQLDPTFDGDDGFRQIAPMSLGQKYHFHFILFYFIYL